MSDVLSRIAVLWEETLGDLRAMLADKPDEAEAWKAEITRRSQETGISLLRAARSVLQDVSRGKTL